VEACTVIHVLGTGETFEHPRYVFGAATRNIGTQTRQSVLVGGRSCSPTAVKPCDWNWQRGPGRPAMLPWATTDRPCQADDHEPPTDASGEPFFVRRASAVRLGRGSPGFPRDDTGASQSDPHDRRGGRSGRERRQCQPA
jgi:hypothetical protein